jgi:hypothetical protein
LIESREERIVYNLNQSERGRECRETKSAGKEKRGEIGPAGFAGSACVQPAGIGVVKG